MPIEIIRQKISRERLVELAAQNYGELIKGVVDIHRRVIALGGELHADAEMVLLQDGSRQQDLWGFNVYPQKPQDARLEYTSFINIRPSLGNRSMEIQDVRLKEQMKDVIDSLVA